MAFRFYFDNILQSPEDLNWQDTKLGLKRFTDFNALFFEYMTSLEFTGAAYDYILTQEQNSGDCDKIELRVDYACNDVNPLYETLFEGIIHLSEVDIDEYNCKASCEAEDNTLSALLVALKDKKVNLLSTLSRGGTTIALCPITTASMVNPLNNAQFSTRNMYKVIDVIRFLMRYISDNTMSVISDFFDNTIQTFEERTITFTNPSQLTTTPPTNIVLRITTPFNQLLETQAAKGGTAAITLNRLLFALKPTLVSPITNNYYLNEWQAPNYVASNGTNQLIIRYNAPFSVGVVSGASASTALVQAAVPGGKNLCIGTGAMLRGIPVGNGSLPDMSFDDVWQELNKLYNLGFSLKSINGIPTMRIEQIDFFFASGGLVSITEVPGLKRSRSQRFAKDSIKVGDVGEEQGQTSAINRKETWYAAGNCSFNNTEDCKSNWVVDHERLTNQRLTTNNKNDEVIFVLEMDAIGGYPTALASKRYAERSMNNDAGVSNNGNMTNAGVCNFWKVRNWLFSCVGNMENPSFAFNYSFPNNPTIAPTKKTFVNTSIPKFINSYKFSFPLTFSQFKSIKDNETNFVNFTPTLFPQDGHDGWIEELEYSLKTSVTEFNLLTQ